MKIDIEKNTSGLILIKSKPTPEEGSEAKHQALHRFAPHITITGFRPGKAPLGLIEAQVRNDKLVEETLSILSSMIYEQAVKEHQLDPITKPQIRIPDLEEQTKNNQTPDYAALLKQTTEEGILIEIKTYITPEINLGDWEKTVQNVELKKPQAEPKVKTKTKPKETGETSNAIVQDPEQAQTDLESQILDKLIETIKFELADELIKGEAQQMIISQVQTMQQLGISFPDYLKTQNKKIEDVEKETEKDAEKILRGRFILAEVGQKLKLGEQTTFKDIMVKLREMNESKNQKAEKKSKSSE